MLKRDYIEEGFRVENGDAGAEQARRVLEGEFPIFHVSIYAEFMEILSSVFRFSVKIGHSMFSI